MWNNFVQISNYLTRLQQVHHFRVNPSWVGLKHCRRTLSVSLHCHVTYTKLVFNAVERTTRSVFANYDTEFFGISGLSWYSWASCFSRSLKHPEK